jgi:acetyl-CoA carboxylase biotin carboxyl carrier protein
MMPGLADQIRELGCWLEGTDIELLELDVGKDVIRLRRDASSQRSAPPPSVAAGTASFDVTAPSVGIFRRTHPLRTAPLVQAWQKVGAGDVVGLLQIGALLVHVVAPKDGIVIDILAEDGAAVDYGTALMRCREGEEEEWPRST